MATARLTKTIVEAAEPSFRDVYLWDSLLPRFGLRVTPTGSRIYLVQYRQRVHPTGSRTRRITIGQHGRPWTIDAARDEAKRLLAKADLGDDPFQSRQEAMKAATVAQARNQHGRAFGDLVERYTAAKLKRHRSGAETRRLLGYDPMRRWKDVDIGMIRRSDVADLLDVVGERSPAVARATYAALRGFFNWAAERELIASSPCDRLRAPPRPIARERHLTDQELAVVWEAAGELGYPFGPLVHLLILTAQRRGEVAGITRAELDLDRGIWRMPGTRTKNGRPHYIDLGPLAISILQALPNVGEIIFPGRGGGHARGFSATKRKLDALVERLARQKGLAAPEEWRLHDLRRTAATGMAALEFAPHIVERVINHASGAQGGLVGVYQRHEYLSQRRDASLAWERKVQLLLGATGASL